MRKANPAATLTIRTSGGDHLCLTDHGNPRHDSPQRDIQPHEPPRQHEARLQIRPAMAHVGWDRTLDSILTVATVNVRDFANVRPHHLTALTTVP